VEREVTGGNAAKRATSATALDKSGGEGEFERNLRRQPCGFFLGGIGIGISLFFLSHTALSLFAMSTTWPEKKYANMYAVKRGALMKRHRKSTLSLE